MLHQWRGVKKACMKLSEMLVEMLEKILAMRVCNYVETFVLIPADFKIRTNA